MMSGHNAPLRSTQPDQLQWRDFRPATDYPNILIEGNHMPGLQNTKAIDTANAAQYVLFTELQARLPHMHPIDRTAAGRFMQATAEFEQLLMDELNLLATAFSALQRHIAAEQVAASA